MSSLEETPNINEKRGTFLKRSSFQKLKCSATYQFQLAGSKLSKAALTHLFEKLILRSRTILQKAFMVLTFPAFKFLCAVVLWWLDVFAKCFGIQFICENKTTAKMASTSISLFVRIQRLHHHAPEKANEKMTQHDKPAITDDVSDELAKSIENGRTQERCSREELDTNIKNQDQATVRENVIDRLVPEIKEKPKIRTSSKGRPNICFVFCVYGCAALVYVQFLALMIALNVSHTPPGLIFLLGALSYIGVIIFKVLSKAKPPQKSQIPAKPKATTPERFRLSRASTQKYLQLHDKALSKIKLL